MSSKKAWPRLRLRSKLWISAASHISSRKASRSTSLTRWFKLATVQVPSGKKSSSRNGSCSWRTRETTSSSASPSRAKNARSSSLSSKSCRLSRPTTVSA